MQIKQAVWVVEREKEKMVATSRSSTRVCAGSHRKASNSLGVLPETLQYSDRGSSGFSALVPGCPNNCNCSRYASASPSDTDSVSSVSLGEDPPSEVAEPPRRRIFLAIIR